jgi:hypothetical protein
MRFRLSVHMGDVVVDDGDCQMSTPIRDHADAHVRIACAAQCKSQSQQYPSGASAAGIPAALTAAFLFIRGAPAAHQLD